MTLRERTYGFFPFTCRIKTMPMTFISTRYTNSDRLLMHTEAIRPSLLVISMQMLVHRVP